MATAPPTTASTSTNTTFAPTVASIPPSTNPPSSSLSSSSSPPNNYYDCPPFTTETDYESYTTRISPRRELICPITQEVFLDPVVAEDGHTYERTALLRWFRMGRTRSPVTNAILTNNNSTMPNLAVQGMALHHREVTGMELLKRAEYARFYKDGVCRDGGARIEALLDAGADTSIRGVGGDTALHSFVLSGNLELSRVLLEHDAPVTMVNDEGVSIVDAAESFLSSSSVNVSQRAEWRDFIDELKRREEAEKHKTEARNQARNRANEEHREQQRNLAAEETRARTERATMRDGRGARGALGDLEDGWGYFPSLAILQFQGAVPPPPPSVVDSEKRAKRRLDVVLRFVGLIVFVYFLLS